MKEWPKEIQKSVNKTPKLKKLYVLDALVQKGLYVR